MPLAAPVMEFVRRMVLDRSGISLDASQDYLVEARLAPLARDDGFRSVDDFIDHARDSGTETLHERITEALTTNETSFMRDPALFDAIVKHALPELILARANERKLTIWSAACSTGQEPYSVAILLRSRFPQVADWDVKIVGTDLCESVLGRAQEGRYTAIEANRGMPATLLIKYFERVGLDWRVRPEIRAMVEFTKLNLIGSWPPLPMFDLILLRNVLIYFDVPVKQRVIKSARKVLRPDGYLVMGAAETLYTVDDSFARIQWEKAVAYRPIP